MKIKVKLNVFIFYLSYTLMLMSVMFRNINGLQNIMIKLIYLCMGLLFINSILNIKKMSKKQMLFFIILVLISIITMYSTSNSSVLLLCLFIISCKDVQRDNLIKYDIILKLILLFIIACLYFNGFTKINIHYRDGIIRHSMGLSNPNNFGSYLLVIVMEIFYLHRNNIKLKDYIYALIFMSLIIYFTGSRTQVICIILFLILTLFLKYKKLNNISNHKIINFLINNLFVILTAFSFFITVLYNQNNELILKINQSMSGRIKITSYVFNQYDLTLLGQGISIDDDWGGTYSVDSLYAYTLLSYGLIVYCVFIYLIYLYLKTSDDENEKLLKIIMIVLLICGLVEKFPLKIEYNIFLLYFSHIAFDNKKLKKGDNNE